MEVEEKSNKTNYGKAGCVIAVLILVLVIILIATGVVNFPWEQ